MRATRGGRIRLFGLALAFAGLGLAGVLFGTQDGLLLQQWDQPVYLASAESLANGDGYRVPFGFPGKAIDFVDPFSSAEDFPPGYPGLLAAGLTSGADSEMVVRWVNAVLLAATPLTVLLIAHRRSRPLWVGGLAAVIALGMTLRFSLAPTSEILYGPLLIVTLFAAGSYAVSRNERDFLLAVLAAATATAVRSIGLALVGTLAVVALMVPDDRRRKWLHALLAVLIGMLPFLLLVGAGTRMAVWHPPRMTYFGEALRATALWIVPPIGNPDGRVIAAAIFLLGLAIWILKAPPLGSGDVPNRIGPRPWLPAALSAVAHSAVLLVTRFVFAANAVASPRLIYPVALSLLVAGLEYTAIRPSSQRSRRAIGALLVLALASALASSWSGIERMLEVHGGAREFNSVDFYESESMELVLSSVPGDKVFSNVPDGIWVAGLEFARPVPALFDPASWVLNRDLEQELVMVETQVMRSGAVIHYYRGRRSDLVGEDQLRAIAPCVALDDGAAIVLVGSESPLCPAR